MLKTNSRFACLVDNTGPNKESRMRRNLPPNREAPRNKKTVSNSFQKKIGYEMDVNNFPLLSTTDNKSTTNKTNMNESYVENLTKPTKQENIVTSEKLPPGWISMNGPSSFIHTNKSKRTIPSLKPRYIDMMNRISTNYVNYKENYIELWGEEEYEHMFLFPNYNYNYLEYDYYTEDEEDDEEEYDDEY